MFADGSVIFANGWGMCESPSVARGLGGALAKPHIRLLGDPVRGEQLKGLRRVMNGGTLSPSLVSIGHFVYIHCLRTVFLASSN